MVKKSERMFVFGDSFVDTGNYRSLGSEAGVLVKGRFGTNPDPMWVEWVALALGLEVRPSAFGGTNYAEGFAMVTLPAPPTPGLETLKLSCKPVKKQVEDFVAKQQFRATDLVVLNGGGNDVLASVIGGSGLVSLQTAATALSETLALIQKAGGQRVAVLETPDLGTTPIAGSGEGDDQNPVSLAVQSFNEEVGKAFYQAGQTPFIVPSFDFTRELFRSAQKFGFAETKATAYPNAGLGAFLFDRSQQLSQAHETYLFADMIHLSGKGHRLYGEYAIKQIAIWLEKFANNS
jgi:outer membrane lipase/esterase